MVPQSQKSNFYFYLVQRSQKVILAAVLMGSIAGISSTGLIALINHLANDGLHGQFLTFLSGFAGLIIIRLIAGVMSKVMLIQLAQNIICELRLALSRKILDSPLSRFEQIGIPRMMAALTDDIVTLSETFGAIPILCIDLSIMIACMVYLGWLTLHLLLMTLMFIVFGVISYRWLANKGLRRLALARQKENTLFEYLRAMTEGFKELKLNAARREEFFGGYLRNSAEDYRNLNIGALRIFAFADGWGEMLFFIPVGLALFLLPSISIVPQQVLWGYVITIIYLIGPLGNIVNLLPGIGRSYVAVQNINWLESYLASESKKTDMSNTVQDFGWQELKLIDICYSYQGNGQEKGFKVGPVNLSLYPGELLFITGGNGSGKSTLAKLITGLYTSETGEIFLNGTCVCTENKAWYNQYFSVIFADYYVFDRLIGIDRDEAASKADAYLRWLGLENKISIVDGEFSTTKLSSGQRRRLAMLSALLEDRPIYVFDEWAADQDAEFREMFYAELLPTLKGRGKGVVVISHDERYFSSANRIIKLDYGKMVADELRPIVTA
jgi:putative ATP-binding cassette transporter